MSVIVAPQTFTVTFEGLRKAMSYRVLTKDQIDACFKRQTDTNMARRLDNWRNNGQAKVERQMVVKGITCKLHCDVVDRYRELREPERVHRRVTSRGGRAQT